MERFVEQYSTAERNECYEGCIKCCGNFTGTLTTWVCCCCPSPYKQIPESNLGVVQEFGRFLKTLPPGLHFVNPYAESLTLVDRRERVIDLKKQAVMTKDNVNVTIDAVVYYHIEDAYKALFAVENVELAIAEIAKTTVRDVFGHVLLQEALETKEKMAAHIKEIIEKPTYNWGVTITRVLIQEILFSRDLQQNLSSAATAKRIAEGKIINAQADVDSAKLMREASDILNTPAAMQIRYLDALTSLAKANNTKIIFMPSESSK
jgi:regulator of protease activity HflC (stomatin/prohibitin superfamily)